MHASIITTVDVNHRIFVINLKWLCPGFDWNHHVNLIVDCLFFSVSNLALVKPEKANAVENYLIQMARFGKLGGKASKLPWLLVSFYVFIVARSMSQQRNKWSFSFPDFRVRIDWDSRKSQSTNRKEDNSHGKLLDYEKCWTHYAHCSVWHYLCSLMSVQQTEGDGLRWWGWLLTLYWKPEISQDIWRGHTSLGLW